MSNLHAIERTDHDGPVQNSSLRPQVETLSLKLRNLRVWGRRLKSPSRCPATGHERVMRNTPVDLKESSLLWVPQYYKACLFWYVWRTCTLTIPTDVAPLTDHRPIATLAHKLDRVLFKCVRLLSYPLILSFNHQPRRPLVTRA